MILFLPIALFLVAALATACLAVTFNRYFRRLRQENLRLQQRMRYWQRRYHRSLSQSKVNAITFNEDDFEALRPGEFAAIIANVTGAFHLN